MPPINTYWIRNFPVFGGQIEFRDIHAHLDRFCSFTQKQSPYCIPLKTIYKADLFLKHLILDQAFHNRRKLCQVRLHPDIKMEGIIIFPQSQFQLSFTTP